jgi:hypothetical protein
VSQTGSAAASSLTSHWSNGIIPALWLVLLVYWIIGAIRAKRTLERRTVWLGAGFRVLARLAQRDTRGRPHSRDSGQNLFD